MTGHKPWSEIKRKARDGWLAGTPVRGSRGQGVVETDTCFTDDPDAVRSITVRWADDTTTVIEGQLIGPVGKDTDDHR